MNFSHCIKKQTWDGVYNAENLNCAFQSFQDTFIRLVNIKITYANKLPWITSGLRESVKKKSPLRSIMENDLSSTNKTNYKEHRNIFISLMRESTCLHSLYLPFSKWRLLGDIHLSV